MINREQAGTSAVSPYSKNSSSRTGLSNYVLNEIYQAMEWFGFVDYIMIASF